MRLKEEGVNKSFAVWNKDDLNSAELKYYLDVNSRVMKMMAGIIE